MTAASKPWADRGSRQARGYDREWERRRAVVLRLVNGHPTMLCRACQAEGHVRVATQCDHIVPKSQGGSDDFSNLQPLCAEHHGEKTQREAAAAQGRTLLTRQRIAEDGWPIG